MDKNVNTFRVHLSIEFETISTSSGKWQAAVSVKEIAHGPDSWEIACYERDKMLEREDRRNVRIRARVMLDPIIITDRDEYDYLRDHQWVLDPMTAEISEVRAKLTQLMEVLDRL